MLNIRKKKKKRNFSDKMFLGGLSTRFVSCFKMDFPLTEF